MGFLSKIIGFQVSGFRCQQTLGLQPSKLHSSWGQLYIAQYRSDIATYGVDGNRFDLNFKFGDRSLRFRFSTLTPETFNLQSINPNSSIENIETKRNRIRTWLHRSDKKQ